MLSSDDVERLLHDDSPDSRSHILEKVAFEYNAQNLSAREGEIAEHIFRLLMRDLSVKVRETLAERMKQNDTVPRDIVLHLAADVESVATPILASSHLLSDADLVTIVEQTHDMGKLLAISRRETVSPRVSGALVDTHYEQVVSALLDNAAAEISVQHLTRIAQDYAENSAIIQSLSEHPNLPISVVEHLIGVASEAVATELKEKYQLSDASARQSAVALRDSFMLRLLEGDLTPAEMEELVVQMQADGSLTPSILMTTLCRGQLLFFTLALAHIAGIPLTNATTLIADRGEHGFTGIYRKSELPESMIDAVRIVVRAVHDLIGNEAIPGSMLYANRLVERVLFEAGDQNIEYLPYFIALIRQNAHRTPK